MSGEHNRNTLDLFEAPPTTPEPRRTPRRNIYLFAAFIFAVSAAPLILALHFHASFILIFLSVAYLATITMSFRIAQEWEKVVVLRLGRFHRIAGPGLFFLIPFFESAALRIDQRIISTPFSAEEALTADLVPTDIDAVLFWVVLDPKRAWCEVEDYKHAVLWSAQTALRDAIGRTNLSDISTQRYQLDQKLKEILNEKVSDWGVSVVSVEIRNILIPDDLQEAMAREAQANQESTARLILAEMESQIAELLSDASKIYRDDSTAFQIRLASILNESIKEGNSSVVVVPSNLTEGFNASTAKPFIKFMKQ